MTNEKPDWIRLHKALAIEAERGFTDLMGREYRFSEFLSLTLGKFPTGLPQTERRRWQGLAVQFVSYPHLALEERQHLVAETRRYLSQLQQEEQGEQGSRAAEEQGRIYQSKIQNPKSKIIPEVSRRLAPKIEQKLSDLPEIGFKKANNLARLGLYTVRDLLFYYPRDPH